VKSFSAAALVRTPEKNLSGRGSTIAVIMRPCLGKIKDEKILAQEEQMMDSLSEDEKVRREKRRDRYS
jgi:hypothetical protein